MDTLKDDIEKIKELLNGLADVSDSVKQKLIEKYFENLESDGKREVEKLRIKENWYFKWILLITGVSIVFIFEVEHICRNFTCK